MTPTPDAETGHILVVDDNEMNRDMLARRLLRQGHTVELAVNGRLALELLTTREFDLVLLDLMMPEMNGYELLEHMRTDEVLRHLPVILVSALDDPESVVRGIEMGADDHLPKPFNPHILRARVGACLAKKRLHDREQIHAKSLERELDIAREIQAGFLPEELPAAPGWEFAARFHPARRVGGDFYDAFALDGARKLGIVVADVCDKGVGAALFMALFRSLVRALAERTLVGRAEEGEDVRELVGGVNDYIALTHGRANMFATLFFGLLDPATGEMVYVNGGHEAPVVIGPAGVRARLAPTGPAVGMLPRMEFRTARETLAPGETLIVFTDGVSDARDARGELFSEERLLSVLGRPAAGASGTLDRIEAAVGAHCAAADPFDDVTLLALRREPGPEARGAGPSP